MKYRIPISVAIEARGDQEALEVAKKLDKLLRTAMVRVAIRDEGIQLADGDGKPVVYAPTREVI